MKSKSTTIKLSKRTKTRLENIRTHRRDTYDDMLQKLLDLLNALHSNPDQAHGQLKAIEKQHRELNKP